MSFWKRLGDVADTLAEDATKVTIGLPWVIAQHAGVTDEATSMASTVGKAIAPPAAAAAGAVGTVGGFGWRHVLHPALEPLIQGAEMFGEADAAVRRPVSRAISTAARVNFDASPTAGGQLDFGNLTQYFSKDEWKRAWGDAANMSPGQVFAAGTLNDTYGLKNIAGIDGDPWSPANLKKRETFFNHTWAGRLSSGAVDFALAWYTDPAVVAGKGASIADRTLSTVKPADIKGALAHSTGDANKAQVGASAARAGRQISDSYVKTDGMTPAEMMTLPQFRAMPDRGVSVAYFYDRANRLFPNDAEARYAAKRDAIGSMLGDPRSIANVKQTSEGYQIQRMMEPNEGTDAASRFSLGDYGQSELDFMNSPVKLGEVDDIQARLQQEFDQHEAALSSLAQHGQAGAFNQTGYRAKDFLGTAIRGGQLKESLFYDGGMMGRPVRMITGALGSRTPGTVNTADVGEGAKQLQDLLFRAPWISPEAKSGYLDDFLKAPSREDRNVLIWRLENHMFNAAGDKYGLTADQSRDFLNAASQVRNKWSSLLKTRLYSAADDAKLVGVVDPEGVVNVYDKPFLQTQIDNAVHITDPKILDDVLKRNMNLRVLERIGEKTVGAPGQALGTALHNAGEATWDLADAGLSGLMQAWKFAALFRFAYGMRIQVDTQLRNLTSMGMTNYLMSLKQGGQNLLRLGDRELNSQLAKPEFADGITSELDDRGFNVAPARTADDLAATKRTLRGHTAVDLYASDASDKMLSYLRGSGDWSILRPSDKGYEPAYLRSVNQQIRQSPLGRALLDHTDEEVSGLIKTDPALNAEWRNFRAQYDSPEQWVAVARNHLDHTLPSDELKAIAAERDLTAADINEHMPKAALRPSVHGESYEVYRSGPIAAFYKQVRDGWFHIMSDIPETVAGRHPLYNQKFREHLLRQVDAHGGDTIDSAAEMAMRRNADRLARRDVSNILFDVSKASGHNDWVRLISPFFAAWEDTMMKWGNLFYDDPSRLAHGMMIWKAPNAAGLVVDSEGNIVNENGVTVDKDGKPIDKKGYRGNGQFIVLPRAFAPIKGAGGARFTKDSLNIVFQGQPWWLPGNGPLVQVPMNQLVRSSFPKEVDNPIVKFMLPFGTTNESVLDQVLPSWVRQLRDTSPSSSDYAQTYTMLAAQEWVKYNKGDRATKPSPAELARATRNWYLLRAVLNNAAPVSIQPTPEMQFYVDQAHRYQRQYGFGDPAKGSPDWQTKFYQDFPQYYEMAVDTTVNNTGIVASNRAYDASKRYKNLIAEHPDYGWLYVGPANDPSQPFARGVYTNQQTQGVAPGSTTKFRGIRDPRQAIDDVEAGKGWVMYDKAQKQIDDELTRRGLHSITQAGAEDLQQALAGYRQQLSDYNPAWGHAFGQRDETKVADLARAVKFGSDTSPSYAARPDTQALQAYFDGRAKIMGLLAKRPSSSLDSPQNADVKLAWDGYVQQLRAWNLGFDMAFSRVLEADKLQEKI